MENETKKSKLTAKDILAKTGPGIIMAAAAVGTGTVTTSAILGARYEYGMIWMVILALFMRGIYMRSAYTAQVVLGMPILDCINKFYGKALCAIAGFVCAFGCVAYEVGNFSGSGISINLLFGLDWKIGGVIMSLVCLLFIFGRSIPQRSSFNSSTPTNRRTDHESISQQKLFYNAERNFFSWAGRK